MGTEKTTESREATRVVLERAFTYGGVSVLPCVSSFLKGKVDGLLFSVLAQQQFLLKPASRCKDLLPTWSLMTKTLREHFGWTERSIDDALRRLGAIGWVHLFTKIGGGRFRRVYRFYRVDFACVAQALPELGQMSYFMNALAGESLSLYKSFAGNLKVDPCQDELPDMFQSKVQMVSEDPEDPGNIPALMDAPVWRGGIAEAREVFDQIREIDKEAKWDTYYDNIVKGLTADNDLMERMDADAVIEFRLLLEGTDDNTYAELPEWPEVFGTKFFMYKLILEDAIDCRTGNDPDLTTYSWYDVSVKPRLERMRRLVEIYRGRDPGLNPSTILRSLWRRSGYKSFMKTILVLYQLWLYGDEAELGRFTRVSGVLMTLKLELADDTYYVGRLFDHEPKFATYLKDNLDEELKFNIEQAINS